MDNSEKSSKYGDLRDGGGRVGGLSGRLSGWWREIVNITIGLDEGWFNSGLGRVVGCGSNTLFWEDVWVGDESLRKKFSGLYTLSLEKEGVIGQMGVWCGGFWVWDWKWSRELTDIELTMLSSLINVLNRFAPSVGVPDSWKWRLSTSGGYITKEVYDLLMARQELGMLPEDLEQGFSRIWNKFVPYKVAGHAWRLLWDRLPTKSNLLRRNILLSTDDSRCVFCSSEEESAKHTFFECDQIYSTWMEIFKWLGISTALNSNTASNLLLFVHSFKGKRGQQVASSIWLGVVWLIWKWRNGVIFRSEVFSGVKLIEDLKIKIWSWLCVKDKGVSKFSYSDWVSNPRMIIETSL